MRSSTLNDNEFVELIRNGPLIAIDLILRNDRGEILLGFRKNGPAKNKWFVPGGRIRKNEKLDDAFRRITINELSREIERKNAELLNIYEHFYQNENKFEMAGLDTHYVVIAYMINNPQDLYLTENEQHSQFAWMKIEEVLERDDVHINTKNYFNNISDY